MPIFKITSTIEFTYEGEFETQADAEKFAGNYDNLQYSMPVDLEIEELEEDEPDEEDIQDPEDEDEPEDED
jgi:hypothetical protein